VRAFVRGIVRALFDVFGAVWPLLIIVGAVAVFVLGSIAAVDSEKEEAANVARIHSLIHEWAKNMHTEVDGISCRFDGGSADCDVHTKDGKREQLRCKWSGCATRGER
jgi:hypothetical protein